MLSQEQQNQHSAIQAQLHGEAGQEQQQTYGLVQEDGMGMVPGSKDGQAGQEAGVDEASHADGKQMRCGRRGVASYGDGGAGVAGCELPQEWRKQKCAEDARDSNSLEQSEPLWMLQCGKPQQPGKHQESKSEGNVDGEAEGTGECDGCEGDGPVPRAAADGFAGSPQQQEGQQAAQHAGGMVRHPEQRVGPRIDGVH